MQKHYQQIHVNKLCVNTKKLQSCIMKINDALLTDFEWLNSVEEYWASIFLNTIEAAERAAAASAAASVPGELASILYTVLGVSMSSGRSQQL